MFRMIQASRMFLCRTMGYHPERSPICLITLSNDSAERFCEFDMPQKNGEDYRMPFAIGRKCSLFAIWIIIMGFVTGCAPLPGSPKGPQTPTNQVSRYPSDAGHQKTDALSLLLVPDLEAVTQSDEHRHIFIRHFAVTSLPEISRAQSEFVTAATAAFTAENKQAPGQEAIPGVELNIRSHLTAVSSKVVGIRINTFSSSLSDSGTQYRTQWFGPRDSAVRGSQDLFGTDDDWTEFKEFVIQAASADSRVAIGNILDLDDEWLDSVNFDFEGNALIEFDDNVLGPGSTGPLVVTVNAARVAPLLSTFGVLAREASTTPSPRVQLDTSQQADPQQEDGVPTPDAGEGSPEPPEEQSSPPRNINCAKTKCVALTFDDGPGPGTGKLLDMLKAAQAPSTFFVTGPNAKLRPKFLKRMAAEGHEIGNHTWSHRSLTALPAPTIQREIDRTNAVIAQAVDHPATLLRPPYGARNSITDRLARTPVILWDVDTLDWKHRNTAKVIDSAVNQSSPGSIVLMHDIHSSTIAAVPKVLEGLRAKGYTFVTVSELLGPVGLKAGESYTRALRPTTSPGNKVAKTLR